MNQQWPVAGLGALSIAVSAWDLLKEVAIIFGEGNGNPLQYSCLENPRYRGAWWAAVHYV